MTLSLLFTYHRCDSILIVTYMVHRWSYMSIILLNTSTMTVTFPHFDHKYTIATCTLASLLNSPLQKAHKYFCLHSTKGCMIRGSAAACQIILMLHIGYLWGHFACWMDIMSLLDLFYNKNDLENLQIVLCRSSENSLMI